MAPGDLWGRVLGSAVDIGKFVGTSLRRTPLFLWVYMALIIWLYKRMVKDFLKQGTSKKRLLGRQSFELTAEEQSVAENLINPATLTTTFDEIGGLQEAKDVLQEHVVWPFKHPEMYQGSLCASPSGLLLHGPPGTGKTLLARALAKELDSYFISVAVEGLFSKYVGESEKLVAAVFSLARKVQPCIIFIDEIDALLSTRTGGDSETYTHVKTIFLTQWDGIASGSNVGDRIIVVGATNRMDSLDEAVLRRLSLRVEVPPPNLESRIQIMLILFEEGGVTLDPDVDLEQAGKWTDGYSGSDLKELCKAAAALRMKEVMKAARSSSRTAPAVEGKGAGSASPKTPKTPSKGLDVRMSHIVSALGRVKPTPQAMARQAGGGGGGSSPNPFLFRWAGGMAH